jgi:hypothetical protein
MSSLLANFHREILKLSMSSSLCESLLSLSKRQGERGALSLREALIDGNKLRPISSRGHQVMVTVAGQNGDQHHG